jgi:hypothetical protein
MKFSSSRLRQTLVWRRPGNGKPSAKGEFQLRKGPLGKLRGRNSPELNEATRLICVHLRFACFSVSFVSLW